MEVIESGVDSRFSFRSDTDISKLVEEFGTHQRAFDAVACRIIELAEQLDLVRLGEGVVGSVEKVLEGISEKTIEAGDLEIHCLLDTAVELWDTPETHKQFSFGVEVVNRDGEVTIWRPQ